jgi:pyruvate,water dikinase
LALHEAGDQIRRLILDSEFSADLSDEITAAYEELDRKIGKVDPAVAVRSSATAEDLPDASFAG